MIVHQVINSFGTGRGGAERLVLALHQDLAARGIDARLIALEACDTEGLEHATTLGFSTPYDLRVLPALARHLKGTLAPSDLIHAHLFPSSAYISALRQARRVRCPCVFTEHNTHNRRRNTLFGRTLDRFIYRGFDRIFPISKGTKAALVEAYPGLRERTATILNGCLLRYDTPPSRSGHVTDRPLLLSVGRLVEQKNYSTILNALALLRDRAFRYVVLGDGAERQALETQVTSLGLQDRVSFPGHVADIGPYLEEADIFIIASRWEGFGLAAVEAMNAALPVVASDVAGLREVVGTDGECARLVSPEDPEAIANAIRALLDDAKLRVALGTAGFDRAKLFDKSRMAEAYIAEYKQITDAQTLGAF